MLTLPARHQVVAKPSADEHADYLGRYIAQVPSGDVLEALVEPYQKTLRVLRGLPPKFAHFAYADQKWTMNEALGHVIDAERIFSARALRIARGDETPLPSFEQDPYIPNSGHNEIALSQLVDEFVAVRTATTYLFLHLPAEAWNRRGTVSGRSITVRALAWVTAGHAIHHFKIFEELYFPATGLNAQELADLAGGDPNRGWGLGI